MDETRDGHAPDAGDFDDGLGDALREAFPRPTYPDEEIETRLEETLGRRRRAKPVPVDGAGRPAQAGRGRWTGSTARPLLAAAAALLLFVGGMEYGRRTAAPPRPETPAAAELIPLPTQPTSLPLTIQSAGSEYVASLARFSGTATQLPAEQRRMAREVALTVLYGAALELLRSSGEDEALREAVRLLSAATVAEGGGEERP